MKELFKSTVDEMVHSLIDEAEYAGVNLAELTTNNFNFLLDDLFNDGGMVRCEKFSDISMEYALEFGEFGSNEFVDAQWECIAAAIERVAHYFKHNGGRGYE